MSRFQALQMTHRYLSSIALNRHGRLLFQQLPHHYVHHPINGDFAQIQSRCLLREQRGLRGNDRAPFQHVLTSEVGRQQRTQRRVNSPFLRI